MIDPFATPLNIWDYFFLHHVLLHYCPAAVSARSGNRHDVAIPRELWEVAVFPGRFFRCIPSGVIARSADRHDVAIP